MCEVALSLVLLAGAGLLIRSFVKLQTVDLGLDPNNILVARLPLPREQYKTAASKQQFFEALLQRLHALPGVIAAAETSTLPPYGGIGTDIDIPGKTHSERWEAIYQLCSDGYFRTLGLKIVRGRTLSPIEVSAARKVAVINQTFANKYFPGDNPIGRQIVLKGMQKLQDGQAIENPTFEVIGVIADAKNSGVIDPIRPEAFVPYTVTGAFERGILVRTQGDPEALLAAVRHEIWAVDRGVAITLTGTLTGYLRQFSYSEPRFSLVLLSVFACVGLVLVAVGVYSVIAYTVARQTREIGIRMALGAGRRDVLQMVSAMGLRLIAFGAAIGVVASIGATRLIAAQLTGVSPHDPLTLAAVVLVMALVGVAACYFPAQRASRRGSVGGVENGMRPTHATYDPTTPTTPTLRHLRGDHRHVPHAVTLRVVDRRNHVFEVREKHLARDRRVRRDGVGVSVTPGPPDRGERLARYPERIDNDVINGNIRKAEPPQDAVRAAADAHVGAGRAAEPPRALDPEVVGVEPPRFEIDHQVVLGDQVDPAAALCHARQLAYRAIGVGDGLQHVAAHDEIELRVGNAELEDAAVVEHDARSERGAARASRLEVAIDDVDAEHARSRQHGRDSIRDFAGAAAGVQHRRVIGKAIPLEERLFLRPDRLGLRREGADHRLVRHFSRLGIEIVSVRQPACSRRWSASASLACCGSVGVAVALNDWLPSRSS